MKLSEYMKHLRKLIEDNPEAKDYVVVCASDDEGNDFNPIIFHPSVGFFLAEGGFGTGEFYAGDDDLSTLQEFHPEVTDTKPNAICVN